MKLTFTVDPEVKVVVTCPAPFCVCALLDSVDWLTVIPVDPVVIVRNAVATLLLVSVAVSVTFPDMPAGTEMYPMNDPSDAAARDAGTGMTICPLNWTIIGELALNPLPIICTVPPMLAEAGVKMTNGIVSVNDAFAEFPDASVIAIVLVAAAVSGIVKLVESAPDAFVVVTLRVTAWPLIFAVTALNAANPFPVTAIVAPLLPVVGETVIAGPTVIAAWTIRFVFASVMVSRYVPAKRLVGITIVVVLTNAFAPEA
jgi:hypothetical protein